MKKLLLFAALFFVAALSAQTYSFDLHADVVKKYQGRNKGDVLSIKGLTREINEKEGPYYSHGVLVNGTSVSDTYTILLNDGSTIPLTTRIDKALEFSITSVDDLWNAAILQDVIPALIQRGSQVKLRKEAEKDALDVIKEIKSQGLEFNDPYLLNYLYTLVTKIAPSTLIDGRPGSVNIMIQDNPELNAMTFPNGTIVINTGLISALHSEDELVAVLAHEIAHFVLDHSIDNILAQIERQKRAAIGAALATVLVAAAEGVAAYHSNGYYMPGAATAATAVLASTIAVAVVEGLGIDYSQNQELEADRYAMQVLSFLGYDRNALATALNRIQGVLLNERSHSMYFASFTHPALVDRIALAGTPSNMVDVEYERMVSFAITNTAFTKYDCRRFKEALSYASQNIKNNVATADDYLLKANCMLALDGSMESDMDVINLVMQAKALDPGNINIFKTEILVQLRLKNRVQAKAMLDEYAAYLDETREGLKTIYNQDLWLSLHDYVNRESEWVDKMSIKLAGMIQ